MLAPAMNLNLQPSARSSSPAWPSGVDTRGGSAGPGAGGGGGRPPLGYGASAWWSGAPRAWALLAFSIIRSISPGGSAPRRVPLTTSPLRELSSAPP